MKKYILEDYHHKESVYVYKSDYTYCGLYQSIKDAFKCNQESYVINNKILKISDKKIAITKIQAYAENKIVKPIITFFTNDLKKTNLTYELQL